MPAASEADPSQLLAIVVPLMFGYMFGDVGQGLVLAAAGWWFRKRWPVARLLMVGGVGGGRIRIRRSAACSACMGSCPRSGCIRSTAPLTVLLAPLVGGAVLLTVGLALNALEALWRGEIRAWLLTDAALVVVYVGLLAAFVTRPAWLVAAAGALWFCVGSAATARRAAARLRRRSAS